MKTYMRFKMNDLKKVIRELNEIRALKGSRYGNEIRRLIQTVSSKRRNEHMSLKIDNLERLCTELHGLELRYGIGLGETIYRFMHSFHKN